MNNSNPFIPQGSLLEQKNLKRKRFQFAVLSIFFANVLLMVSILLIQGCSKPTSDSAQNDGSNPLLSSTNNEVPPAPNTNTDVVAPLPQPPANPVVAGTTTTPNTGMPVAPANPSGMSAEYVVAPGDSFATIAKKFPGVTAKAIAAANPEAIPTKLKIGFKLHIPAPTATAMTTATGTPMMASMADAGEGVYVVKSGDTLGKIATTHSVSVKVIRSLNPSVATTDRIHVGDKLKLPARSPSALAPVDSMGGSTTPTTPVSNTQPSSGMGH
jgi:LysM repeat protein